MKTKIKKAKKNLILLLKFVYLTHPIYKINNTNYNKSHRGSFGAWE